MTTPSGTEARVCADIARRQELGIAKYGTTVEANPLSLRQWLQHGYEEALDLAVYLKRSIDKIDASVCQDASAAISKEQTAAADDHYDLFEDIAANIKFACKTKAEEHRQLARLLGPTPACMQDPMGQDTWKQRAERLAKMHQEHVRAHRASVEPLSKQYLRESIDEQMEAVHVAMSGGAKP